MSKTNAERLKWIEQEKELIIDGITNKIIGVELTLSDYAFLHSEVKRAQETEKFLKEYQTDWEILIPELTKLKDENDALRSQLSEITVTKYNKGRPSVVDWNGERWVYDPQTTFKGGNQHGPLVQAGNTQKQTSNFS